MMNMRTMRIMALVVAVVFGLSACEKLAGFQNYKSRIKGEWKTFDGGFVSDETFEFSSGMIARDGFEWGTYKFLQRDELEVSLGDQVSVYLVDYKDEKTMFWYQIIDERRVDLFEWHRQ